jgi:aspartate racemase
MARKTLGILGGMGPLASLAFLRTIYECNGVGPVEQAYPDIVLHSLSSVPDRTQCLLCNEADAFAQLLVKNLTTLSASGVAKIVICCFTSHALIGRLPQEIAGKVVSLVDLTARELMIKKERSLLLASMGSYRKEVFRSTADAVKATDFIVEPDENDQQIIQRLIYDELKPGKAVAPVGAAVKALLGKYALNSFIAGCTEFHLLSRYIEANHIPGMSFVDPLFWIARGMDHILA